MNSASDLSLFFFVEILYYILNKNIGQYSSFSILLVSLHFVYIIVSKKVYSKMENLKKKSLNLEIDILELFLGQLDHKLEQYHSDLRHLEIIIF